VSYEVEIADGLCVGIFDDISSAQNVNKVKYNPPLIVSFCENSAAL
jgi:hypothetical protein